VGVVPPLGSSFKLRLSLRVHRDSASEGTRNVRAVLRVKREGFAEADTELRDTQILNKGEGGGRLRFKRKNERPQADMAHTG
jgi:hypothetical protein